ncbi:MAG: porin [Burkholderiales bacterium]|nr:porin [Burkholderiales bacterium]
MNKKLMAVAVAGVLTAPAAFAQSSNVQLYGRANLGIDQYKATGSSVVGADRSSRVRVFDNSSRVGLRGTEELGGGLKAIFQIESGVNIDNGSNIGQGGQANVSSGFWAGRDSYAGLQGNWGRVTFGRQSIFWANGLNGQHAANYVNTEIPWANGTGLGRMGSTIARVSNTVAYTSPTFAGINGTLSYSPNFQESVQSIGASVDSDGQIWGITLRGTWGQFYGQYDYGSAEGNTSLVGATSLQRKVTGHKLGASWGYMPGARVGGTYVMIRDDLNPTVSTTVNQKAKQNGWYLFWEHTFGQFQVMAEYGQTDDLDDCGVAPILSCASSASKGYMVGGRYFLSKRTWVYLTYNQISNEANQFSDYFGAAITSTSGAPTPYGADPKIFALGLFHTF